MQIVSSGDNLHEMPNLVVLELCHSLGQIRDEVLFSMFSVKNMKITLICLLLIFRA